MAYTQQFELLFNEVQERYQECSRHWVYRRLCALRKQGRGKTRIKKSSEADTGLTLTQVRILRLLREKGYSLTKSQIASMADVHANMDGSLGASNIDQVEEKDKELGKRTLRGRGYITAELDYDSRERKVIKFAITESGVMALEGYEESKRNK
jgi:hypothetical protein